jgi:serine/threonine protein phosphatase PrpC
VSDERIAQILHETPDLHAAAAKLIAQANENGGPDNVTAVLVRWAA